MAHRYRMYPDPAQEAAMVEWCGQARAVWNVGLEQRGFYRPGMRGLSGYDQKRFLTEARAEIDWLAAGPSVVQQQALLDLDQAFKNWWGGTHRRPTKRHKGVNDGFVIRDLNVAKLSRKWATVLVPKVGPVRFRLHRPLPEGTKSARVTLDRAGRWHVSLVAVPPMVAGPGDATIVGVDRGVALSFACSDGTTIRTPGLRPTEATRLLRLQRRMVRQVKGSNRRARTKHEIARIKAREVDRRKDCIEKATTGLARRFDIVRIEDLRIPNMIRSAKGTIEVPGTNVAQKRGLNRGIAAQEWGLFAQRLGHKIGDRLELVPAAFTSQRCSCCGIIDSEARESQASFRCRSCGHTANADVNAALNIAAGHAVSGRGGNRAIRRPCEASTDLIGAA